MHKPLVIMLLLVTICVIRASNCLPPLRMRGGTSPNAIYVMHQLSDGILRPDIDYARRPRVAAHVIRSRLAGNLLNPF
ncbi:uncharacterized protein BJ212DRAFT_639099 [Suillus subaureus]|uniref:Secreted protein n=1 Tax=Suillus subaureus TaxID=48587 RepID=A0A9P7E1M3_9AGAM|nr:uncharacterized protein BJ212DRAFT_639099 [Suillus subaureus]KAG1808609.1 hypothetical protein BJ212DRAFT_639099 [Suillus subaureus]